MERSSQEVFNGPGVDVAVGPGVAEGWVMEQETRIRLRLALRRTEVRKEA
jgi:hypothetical protein